MMTATRPSQRGRLRNRVRHLLVFVGGGIVAASSSGASAEPPPSLRYPPVPDDSLRCILPVHALTLPSPLAPQLAELAPGDLVVATGEIAPGEGGWIERAAGGWLLAAAVDRLPIPVEGDLPAGREGMALERVLPDDYVPSDLVTIPDSLKTRGYEGKVLRLRAPAAAAFEQMIAAAAGDGITIRLFSAWRSAGRQRKLYGRAVGRDPAQTSSARPGRSEHRLGTTADVSTPGARTLHVELARTPAGRWITEHGPDFGVIVSFSKARHAARGVAWEPWHLRWVGSAAREEDTW